MKLVASGSQTVGPFFSIGLTHLCSAELSHGAPALAVRGRVLDGNGDGVPDAMLEIWQADSHGEYSTASDRAHGLPSGFGRVATDEHGCFHFTTCRPGEVPFDDKTKQAPHLVVLVFCRGLLRQLITRMYFAAEPENEHDPVLKSIPEYRRRTLIAQPGSSGAHSLEWNIVLQGEGETVFFAW
jgi:protocatechuate 3,4-dioxygenase, alpha subunit